MPKTRWTRRALLILIAGLTLTAQPASAWHDEGHYYAAVAAVNAMPEDVPAFFREGSATVGHSSIDPDAFKHRDVEQLNHCEAPEHYLDLELLKGEPLPPLRYDFLKMCHEMQIDPTKAGLLPYSIAEWTQRLTIAFAEHRQYPDNPHIKAKCLVYAGVLSHYAADLHMPLHTSIHWDGRAVEGEPYVGTGIHHKIDALPTKVPYNELFAEPLPTALPSRDIFTFTIEELIKSNALVDKVYDMEEQVPEQADMSPLKGEVLAFTIDRQRAAASFTADLLLSAWRNSADVQMPRWLDRTVFDETFDPAEVPAQPGR